MSKKKWEFYIGEIVDKDKLTKFEQYRIKQMSYSLYKKNIPVRSIQN